MIILRLRGSLGNQLFQYRFARSLSIETGQFLLIDKFPIQHYHSQSGYSLDLYRINGLCPPFNPYKYVKTLQKYIGIKLKSFDTVISPELYIPSIKHEILSYGKNVVVDGNWQSFKYFENHWETLNKEVQLKKLKLIDYQKGILDEVVGCNSVSVHIRRGDYLKSREHNNLDLNYYNRAIEYIRDMVKHPKFYFFSDDMEWVKQEFNGDGYIFLDQNITSPQNDLYIMSKTKHNIIANSSFSWWGGWLNENNDKIVVAPSKWFSTSKRNNKLGDLLPSSWIKL